MPWVEKCIHHLPHTLKNKQCLKALTFLSCIGLIENGDFVSFAQGPGAGAAIVSNTDVAGSGPVQGHAAEGVGCVDLAPP